ncbi:serine/threonine/tyrosine-interacting protein-like [Trichosurus vulpecula]|uniref:serine/threonine/tyrosine-interacting protein-like n=1 Tax=Trichosurus vulpecula TaxID=9337 RepID=UPI00186AC384|nr:serine/threonine/tyrosine-interacting protein-like [Trichosurus vulpecula]
MDWRRAIQRRTRSIKSPRPLKEWSRVALELFLCCYDWTPPQQPEGLPCRDTTPSTTAELRPNQVPAEGNRSGLRSSPAGIPDPPLQLSCVLAKRLLKAMEHFLTEHPCLPLCRAEDVESWTYRMRRELQEIVPGLFLGPYSSAMKNKLPELQNRGITHVICVRQSLEAKFIKPNFPQILRYLVLEIADTPVENIVRFFAISKEFIDGSLQGGGKVLVHGNAGISRSASLVIAYVMETFRMKFNDAFILVKGKRYCVYPNAGFVRQLQEYEDIYLAKLAVQPSPLKKEQGVSFQADTSGNLKPRHEEEEEEEPGTKYRAVV